MGCKCKEKANGMGNGAQIAPKPSVPKVTETKAATTATKTVKSVETKAKTAKNKAIKNIIPMGLYIPSTCLPPTKPNINNTKNKATNKTANQGTTVVI